MSADRLTLKSFFCADPATPIADGCDMRAARKAVDLAAVGLPPLTRKNLFKAVAGALDEFFQVNLDDILESGRTLAFAKDLLSARGAAHIYSCVLLEKSVPRAVEIEADFRAFSCPEVFVVVHHQDAGFSVHGARPHGR